MINFVKDILKVKDPEKEGKFHFSQSRVYLFISFICIVVMAMSSFFLSFDNQNFKYALDTMFWVCLYFASYALVGKGMKYMHLKDLLKTKGQISGDQKEDIMSGADNNNGEYS